MSTPTKYSVLAIFSISVIAVAVVLFALRRNYGVDPDTRGSNAERPGESETRGFRDVALESGLEFRMTFLPNEQGEKFKINLYDHGCGVVVGDYDGDGHDDIYFLNQLGPNALYKNRGNGTFMDVSEEAGVGLSDRICVGGTFADYDNDGDQDLYVTTTRGGNVLFQNQGNGRFQDVTEASGVTWVGHSQTPAFFDYDNDGYLDLFVTNSAEWTTNSYDEVSRYYVGPPSLMEMASSPKEHNVLYHNNRDGTFTNVTEEAGMQGDGWAGDVAIADYDEDGRLDLFVSNMFGIGHLYHNEGGGKFRDVGKEVFGRTSWGTAGSRFFDFNNDGRFDLFITDMHSDMWVTMKSPIHLDMVKQAAKKKFPGVAGPYSFSTETDAAASTEELRTAETFQIRYDDVVFGNTFFKNLGGGRFEEVSDRAGLETFWPWGIATGDFDNDGFEDAFVPAGMGYPYFYWPNYLMMNNGNESFTDRAEAEGIEPPAEGFFLPQKIGQNSPTRSSRCAATGDFDGDGRLEIIVNNFNDHPYYYKNRFAQKNYLALRLKGTRSNWDAIGAVVKIHSGNEVMLRQVQAAGGYLSQSSKTVHFGLGDRSKIDHVEIRWPSGVHQLIENPEINQLHVITEM